MYAYVCKLSNNNHIDGVLVLNENLKSKNSKYRLLCLVDKYIDKDNIELLEKFNIEYKILNLDITSHHPDEQERYKIGILNTFSLIEYEKLVYLDLDLLINKNIDELFEYPEIAMVKNSHNEFFNTGVIVIKPDLKLYDEIIKYSNNLQKETFNNIINSFIIEKKLNIKELPSTYNSFRKITNTMIDVIDSTYHYDKNINEVEIISQDINPSIIHYIGENKPFMKNGEYNDDYYNIYMYYLNKINNKKEKINKEKNLISIIVPIYNRESYLTRTLDSIISQTHKNLEIILIDDCSTDKSLNICNNYKKFDSRIKIIKNKENKGVSYSRNRGLEIAKGDYIGFVDSDDYIEENMYEILLDDLLKTETDFSQCGRIVNEKKEAIFNERNHTIYGNKKIIKQFLTEYIVSPVVWDKLFKREKIKKIKFKENYKKNEDAEFVFEVLKNTNSYTSNNCYLYHYSWRRHDSLSYKFSLKNDLNLIEYHHNIENFVNKYYPSLKDELNNSKLGLYIHMLNEINKFECYKYEAQETKDFLEMIANCIISIDETMTISEKLKYCNKQLLDIKNKIKNKINKKTYKHIIITYFNAYTDYIDYNNISPKKINTYKYLEQRFKIFEEITLPSIKSQTCQNFEWIIVFNSDTPKKYKDRIKQLKKEFRFTDLYFEKGEYFNFDLYVSDKYKEYKWFLTTRLDNDDMIGKNYVGKVQKIVEKDDSKKIITFEKGLKYDYINKKYYKTNRIGNHFLSCFSTCDSSVYSYEHDSIGKNNSDILYIDSKTDNMWVEVIHDTNVINYIEPALDIPIEKVSI